MTQAEKVAEQIAVLLMSLPADERESASSDAWDMAQRAEMDWWTLVGRPYYNERLESLRRKLILKDNK